MLTSTSNHNRSKEGDLGGSCAPATWQYDVHFWKRGPV